MKVVQRNLSLSEIADLKKQKEKFRKKAISDIIIVGVLTFFGLMVLLLICEKFGLITPSGYSKPALIGLSVLNATIFYLKKAQQFKKQDSLSEKVTQYTFTITDYYNVFVSNTEYEIYACKTTDDKTVVFHTSQFLTNKLYDTFIIDLLKGKIVSINNYSTGKTVNQLNLDKKLIEKYDGEFYLLDKDINDI